MSVVCLTNIALAAATVTTGKVKSVEINAADGQLVFSIQDGTETTFFEVNNSNGTIIQMIADTLNAAMSEGDDVQATSTDPSGGAGTEADPHPVAKVKRIK